MNTVIQHTLRRFTGQILGWGLTFGLIALYLMVLYKPMSEQQAELKSLFDSYGENMMAFFGGQIDILSPGGYLDFSFFSYIPVVAGIFAVIFGSGLVVADEEKGTLDLVMAYPISRSGLFWGRWLALTLAMLLILMLSWLGFTTGLPFADWDVSPMELLLPHLSLLVVMMLFGTMALCLGFLLPSRMLAASLSGALLVGSYLITSLARVNDKLDKINTLLPLNYYQGGSALKDFEWGNLLGLMVGVLVFGIVAWWLFLRRDIRVSGEGSWSFLNR